MSTVIIRPIVTEKSSQAQEKGIYTFVVEKNATKIDVKKAMENIYGEKVKKVTMLYIKAKLRTVGRGKAFKKRPKIKKAIITLKGKKKLDFSTATPKRLMDKS